MPMTNYNRPHIKPAMTSPKRQGKSQSITEGQFGFSPLTMAAPV